MREMKKVMVITALLIGALSLARGNTIAVAKAKEVKMNLIGAKMLNKYPAALSKAKKVKVRSSRKSIVTAKYKKIKNSRWIVLKAKKVGSAVVTVRCRMKNHEIKTYKYKVTVAKGRKMTVLEQAKRAFRIQNRYREEKGVDALEWSDELYKFCLYRLKTSGYDRHENLCRDENAYFGLYAKYKKIMLAENLHSGYSDPESAMESWKKSPGHYTNLLSATHVCGAIAKYKNVWCAIFYDGDKKVFENWRDYQIKEINVKRYDNNKGEFIGDCAVGYYEMDDRWDTLQAAMISEASGEKIYLEVGKTYVIYERRSPDGCEKAKPITITVTDEGNEEVVLTS